MHTYLLDPVKRQIQMQKVWGGLGLCISSQLPGGTNAGPQNILGVARLSASLSFCSPLRMRIIVRHIPQKVCCIPTSHSCKKITKPQSKIPIRKSLPNSLSPHYWNFSKTSLIPYCCPPSHCLCFKSSAELLGNWGQK